MARAAFQDLSQDRFQTSGIEEHPIIRGVPGVREGIGLVGGDEGQAIDTMDVFVACFLSLSNEPGNEFTLFELVLERRWSEWQELGQPSSSSSSNTGPSCRPLSHCSA